MSISKTISRTPERRGTRPTTFQVSADGGEPNLFLTFPRGHAVTIAKADLILPHDEIWKSYVQLLDIGTKSMVPSLPFLRLFYRQSQSRGIDG